MRLVLLCVRKDGEFTDLGHVMLGAAVGAALAYLYLNRFPVPSW